MKITAVKYGQSLMGENMMFQNGTPDKKHVISFTMYLIEDNDKLILVDSGCDTMPGWDMSYFCGPEHALKDAGVLPSDITDVIITHAHHDHIESVGLYKNAVVHIQKDELVAGKAYIPDDFRTNAFDDECYVTDNVCAKKIGGHSVGSCIVSVKTERGEYVITGDECYSRECITRQIPTGCSVNIEKSRRFIEEYKDKNLLLCHDDAILPDGNGAVRIV